MDPVIEKHQDRNAKIELLTKIIIDLIGQADDPQGSHTDQERYRNPEFPRHQYVLYEQAKAKQCYDKYYELFIISFIHSDPLRSPY